MADSLAKNHNSTHYLDIKHNNIYNTSYTIQYNKYTFEQPTRKSIKNICNSHIIAMWSSQHRISNIIPISSQIDWNATWLYLNNNHKRTYNYTNFQLSHSKSHKVKILLNILPTLTNLHTLYPQHFPDNNCITCNTHEHSLHWMLCPNPTKLNNIIQQTIHNTISSLDIPTHDLLDLQYTLTQHPCLSFNNTTSLQTNIFSTLQGFIPTDLITTFRQYSFSHQESTTMTIQLLTKISQQTYEQIWKPYCSRFSQWKKDHNIPSYNCKTYNKQQRTRNHHPQNRIQTPKSLYTYNCICGLPDHQHTDNNTCPPLGQALRKIDLWIKEWILHSTPTNHILYYQI